MCMGGGGGGGSPPPTPDPKDSRYWSPSRRIQDLMDRSDASVSNRVGLKLKAHELRREEYKANPFLLVANGQRAQSDGRGGGVPFGRVPRPYEDFGPEVAFRGDGLGVTTPVK